MVTLRDARTALMITTLSLGNLRPARAAVVPMSLDACIAQALKENLSLAESGSALQAAEADEARVRVERALRVTVGSYGSQEVFLYSGRDHAESFQTAYVEAGIGKRLFANRELRHAERQSGLIAQIFSQRRRGARHEVIFIAKSRYWHLVRQQTLVDLYTRARRKRQEIAEITRAKEKYGYSSHLDGRWARVQLALADDDLARAQGDLDRAREDLAMFLRLEPGTVIVASAADRFHEPDFAELERTSPSDKSTPANREAALEVFRREEDRRYARRRFIPTFTVGAGSNYSNGSGMGVSLDDRWNFSVTGKSPLRNDVPVFYRNNRYVNFRATYDLFDGGRARSDLKAASARLDQARQAAARTASETTLERTSCYFALRSARGRYAALRDVAKAADATSEAAEIRSRRGQISLSDRLQIESESIEALRKLEDAVYDLRVSAEALRRSLLKGDYEHDQHAAD